MCVHLKDVIRATRFYCDVFIFICYTKMRKYKIIQISRGKIRKAATQWLNAAPFTDAEVQNMLLYKVSSSAGATTQQPGLWQHLQPHSTGLNTEASAFSLSGALMKHRWGARRHTAYNTGTDSIHICFLPQPWQFKNVVICSLIVPVCTVKATKLDERQLHKCMVTVHLHLYRH